MISFYPEFGELINLHFGLMLKIRERSFRWGAELIVLFRGKIINIIQNPRINPFFLQHEPVMLAANPRIRLGIRSQTFVTSPNNIVRHKSNYLHCPVILKS